MNLKVVVDERLRLLTAALLLTDLPAREQRERPHKVHPLAAMTATQLGHLRAHPCVLTIATVAERSPFLLIVPHFLRLSWPDLVVQPGVVEPWAEIGTLTDEGFLQSLRTFRDEVDRTGLWQMTTPIWKTLVDDLRRVLAERDLIGFLDLFWGDTGRIFIVLPNPLAPRGNWIGLYAPTAHYAVLPPWMIPPDSTLPVAYGHRAVYTRSVACHELSHGAEFHSRKRTTGLEPAIADVMAHTPVSQTFRRSHPGPIWPFTEVLLRAIQALYLRHNEDDDAATSFMQRTQQREGLDTLPSWVDRLEPYLEGRKVGRYTGWHEYLAIFLSALRAGS